MALLCLLLTVKEQLGLREETLTQKKRKTNKHSLAVVVAHTFNPSTRKAEAGRSLSLRPA